MDKEKIEKVLKWSSVFYSELEKVADFIVEEIKEISDLYTAK